MACDAQVDLQVLFLGIDSSLGAEWVKGSGSGKTETGRRCLLVLFLLYSFFFFCCRLRTWD